MAAKKPWSPFDSYAFYSPQVGGKVVYKDGQWYIEISGSAGESPTYVPYYGNTTGGLTMPNIGGLSVTTLLIFVAIGVLTFFMLKK